MPARLIESLTTTSLLGDVFSDESVLQAMLDFETALAGAEARVGVITRPIAEAISAACGATGFDVAALSEAALRAGTPGIPLVTTLREQVQAANPEAAAFVHWGATSQDVTDTATVLLLKRAQSILSVDLARLENALHELSNLHKDTLMLGRTLLQPAPPISFGLKVAGWLAAIRRCRVRLDEAFQESCILQFGGASGTLASLGKDGLAVAGALAENLKLPLPDAPWHSQRDRLGTLMCSCGLLTASLGKMARDVSLLMQNEVHEAAEPGGEGRGGSSAMPHKQNPIACALALASAQRVPGMVSAFLSAMVQEHERAVGGWQAEWPIISGVVQATGIAAASMAEVAEGLSVNPDRMRANIAATRGAIFAERAMTLLSPALGRDSAARIIADALQRSAAENKDLAEVLAEIPQVRARLSANELRRFSLPEEYLGSAEEFRRRAVSPSDDGKER